MFDKLIITTVLIISLVGCNKQGGEIKSMADLKQRVDKLSNLSKDVEGRRTELYRLIHQYNSQLPEKEQFDIASVDTTIGEPEKELVRAMFREEKDITYNGLLGTIINKNNEIRELENQISKLVNQLPAPYSVQKGDTHYDIVMNYLINQHGMNKKEAHQVAFKTAMIDDILPGNQVWLMYNNGIVGTYVTQGTAKVNPVTFQRLARKRLIEQSKVLSSTQSPSTVVLDVD